MNRKALFQSNLQFLDDELRVGSDGSVAAGLQPKETADASRTTCFLDSGNHPKSALVITLNPYIGPRCHLGTCRANVAPRLGARKGGKAPGPA